MGFFDLFRRHKKPEAVQQPVDWMPLVDKLAHFQSMTFDRSEEAALEQQLLAGGNDALQAIVHYLKTCAYGQQSEYWWSDAAFLVRMIAKFPGADVEPIYRSLMSIQTNIWEYHTQIKDVAEQELLKCRKQNGAVSPEDAMAELKKLYNLRVSEDERLRQAHEMCPFVSGWSDECKAFFYYIVGDALRVRNRSSAQSYPFYAAQIFYQSQSTSLGWHELKQIPEYKELAPTAKNAKMLHEKYPIPDEWR